MNEDQDNEHDRGTGVATILKPKVTRPSMYKVILLNDDYTTMDFVIHVLKSCFNKSEAEAHKIMLSVHQTGKGVCGIYPYGVAETKISQVQDLAQQNEMPLRCTMEKE